jgi:hypothetical protein
VRRVGILASTSGSVQVELSKLRPRLAGPRTRSRGPALPDGARHLDTLA